MIENLLKFLKENQDLINIASGIGTFISAIIAILTLREVIKQRLSTYKPEVVIKSFIVSISKSPFSRFKEELLLYRVTPFNDYSVNSNEKEFGVSKLYKVENIGFGPAKNVICEWSFDTKDAIQKIEKILPANYSFSNYEKLNTYFLNNSLDDNFHYAANVEISKQKIDFISPVSVKDHFSLHSIPEIVIYTHYLYLLMSLKMLTEESKNFYIYKFRKFPKPKLHVSFLDINNKKYKKEFSFNVTAVSVSVDSHMRMDKEFAMLQFEVE